MLRRTASNKEPSGKLSFKMKSLDVFSNSITPNKNQINFKNSTLTPEKHLENSKRPSLKSLGSVRIILD